MKGHERLQVLELGRDSRWGCTGSLYFEKVPKIKEYFYPIREQSTTKREVPVDRFAWVMYTQHFSFGRWIIRCILLLLSRFPHHSVNVIAGGDTQSLQILDPGHPQAVGLAKVLFCTLKMMREILAPGSVMSWRLPLVE